MKEADLCPVCKCPRKEAGSGSLTQWIVVCNCDSLGAVSEVAEETESLPIDLCRKCGKRISQGRAGSFTQYIFRSDLCACEVPEAYRAALPVDTAADAPSLSVNSVQEEALFKPDKNLQLDTGGFPSERYEALRQLGRGGGGRVYLARDLLLNKLVAVKLLNSFDEKQIIAFQTEARATSKLNHQGIVRLLDFGVVGDSLPYMVLDYVPGASLEEVLAKRGRLEWTYAREIFYLICDALAFAHDQGIYHRDLKPGNILLIEDEEGTSQVKLIDFGLARIAADPGKAQDSGGKTMVGAPLYMSPDQARGYEYDARSEIYSLGCVLFETLVGSPPFKGDSPLVTLSLHSEAPVPQPCRKVPSLPAVLDEIIIRALAKDPEDRYGSVAEFREALAQIDRKPEEKDDSGLAASPRKSLLLPASLALAVFFSFALIGFIFYRPPDDQKPKLVEELPPKEAKTLADLKYEKNESFAANIPDAMVDKELNWTGGKWKVQEISKFNLLEAEGHEVNDADFKEIAANKKVNAVKLTMESTATGTGFAYLNSLDLSSVWIMSNYFNDEGAKSLAAFPDITTVKIHAANNMTAAGFEPIISLPRLHTLKLRKTFNLPRGACAVIGKSRTLKNLALCYMSDFTPEDMENIARISTLKSLDLNGTTSVDDRYVSSFSKLPLRSLYIGLTGVSDRGLMELAKIKELKVISLTVRYPAEVEELKAAMGRQKLGIITEAGLAKFRTLRPDCQISLYKQISPLGIY